jgi:transcription factor S
MNSTAFCPKCGGLLVPAADKKNMQCSCGYVSRSKADLALIEKTEAKELLKVKEDFNEALPKVKEDCPKCKHEEAFNWNLQTRAADEAETAFYRCCKCNHTWREYA